MSNFKPTFEVTQVSSMQWNRTQSPVLEAASSGNKPVDIPEETLNSVRLAIQNELTAKRKNG